VTFSSAGLPTCLLTVKMTVPANIQVSLRCCCSHCLAHAHHTAKRSSVQRREAAHWQPPTVRGIGHRPRGRPYAVPTCAILPSQLTI
jgi:hypothetical protein